MKNRYSQRHRIVTLSMITSSKYNGDEVIFVFLNIAKSRNCIMPFPTIRRILIICTKSASSKLNIFWNSLEYMLSLLICIIFADVATLVGGGCGGGKIKCRWLSSLIRFKMYNFYVDKGKHVTFYVHKRGENPLSSFH